MNRKKFDNVVVVCRINKCSRLKAKMRAEVCRVAQNTWNLERRLIETYYYNSPNCGKVIVDHLNWEKDITEKLKLYQKQFHDPATTRARFQQRAQNCRMYNPNPALIPTKSDSKFIKVQTSELAKTAKNPLATDQCFMKKRRSFIKSYALFATRGVPLLRKPNNSPYVIEPITIEDRNLRSLTIFPNFRPFCYDNLNANSAFYVENFLLLMQSHFAISDDLFISKKPPEKKGETRLDRLKYLKSKKLENDRIVDKIADEICNPETSALWDDVFEPFTWCDIPEDLKDRIDKRLPERNIPFKIAISPEKFKDTLYVV